MKQKSAVEKVQDMIDGKLPNGFGHSTEEAFQIMEAFPGQVFMFDPEMMSKEELLEMYNKLMSMGLDPDTEIFVPEEVVKPAPQGIDYA